MPKYRFLAVFLLAALAACSRAPDAYAPPVQRKPLPVSQPSFIGSFVSMSDPNADAYVLKDVSEAVEAGSWRWAKRRPELQFYIASPEGHRFVMEFSIADATFKETGPVTLAILVNGKPLHTQRYDKPGQYTMQAPVPRELLKADSLNQVAIEPDKVWVSKTDGAALGFILSSAGFQP